MTTDELHERAIDQLVDEASIRVHQLRQLLGGHQPNPAWPTGALRSAATLTIGRLTTPNTANAAATAIIAAVAPASDLTQIPAAWWTTPLGRLTSSALKAPTEAPQRMTPRHDERHRHPEQYRHVGAAASARS